MLRTAKASGVGKVMITDPCRPRPPRALLVQARRSLGNDPDCNPYVPCRKSGQDPYRLSPAVRCDWTRFQQLAEHALPTGPSLPDLEKALSLVRGTQHINRELDCSLETATE